MPGQDHLDHTLKQAHGRRTRLAYGILRLLKRLARNRIAAIGITIIILEVLFSFLGPLLYHTSQTAGNLSDVNLPPSPAHLLGTDDNGFDVLGRLMVGGRISLEIGVAVAAIAISIGVVVGTLSGYFGKAVDVVLMRVVDMGLALPPVYLFIFFSLIFKPSVGLLILILGCLSWFTPARLIRGETLRLRTREYVSAARVMGARRPRILVRHVLPNVAGTIIVNGTFQVADAVIVLALLNYLGFSLPPPTATWGGMLSSATQFLADGYWWQVYPPLLIIILTVVAFNLVGDGLRDMLEVRLLRR